MSTKPSIFIGSSSEALRIAEQAQHNLQTVARPKLWTQGVFGLGQAALEALIVEVSKHDFAILVLSPDDRTTSRDIEQNSPRDNVVFELGLFMGKLGREHTFVLYDEAANLKLLSDLAGITLARYDGKWANDDLAAAIGTACHPIREAVRNLWPTEATQSKRLQYSPGYPNITRPLPDGWNQTCSQPGAASNPWAISQDDLEIDSAYIGANAYYIWSKSPVTSLVLISFDCSFHRTQAPKPDFPDLRLVLFGKSPNATYASSPQLLLHIPWELKDELLAAVVGAGNAKDVGGRGTAAGIGWDTTKRYVISVSENIAVSIDGETKLRILRSDVAAAGVNVYGSWYWGFSTVGGHLSISNVAVTQY